MEEPGFFPLRVLWYGEAKVLLVPLVTPALDYVWIKEGFITLPGGDARFEEAMKRIQRLVDVEASTPRLDVKRTPFERLAVESLGVHESANRNRNPDGLRQWLDACEEIVKDAALDADRRLAAIAWRHTLHEHYQVRVTQDKGASEVRRLREERLKLLARADQIKGGEAILRFGIALRKAELLATLELRREAMAEYKRVAEDFKAVDGWAFHHHARIRLRRLEDKR